MFFRLTHNDLRVKRRLLVVPHLPALLQQGACGGKPYRLVQISDLHFYEYTSAVFYDRVACHIDSLSPDVLMMTGDLVHYGSDYLEMASGFLSRLQASDGCYAVLGNHDHKDGNHSLNVRETLCASGFQLLQNSHVRIKNDLVMAGIDDYKRGQPDISHALAGVVDEQESLNEKPLVVMMAHNPNHFDAVAANTTAPVDLMFSGHTHGGHVYIPVLGPIYRHVFKMKYRYGFFQKEQTRLYVTSGLAGAAFYMKWPGFQRGFPRYRFNTQPEVAVFDLFASEDALHDYVATEGLSTLEQPGGEGCEDAAFVSRVSSRA